MQKYKADVIALVFISLLIPLFFYKLGQSSLTSFDEAWYGAISHNIIKNSNLLDLSYNNKAYTDHPPAGFWLMAASMSFLGKSALSVRFVSALLGFFSLVTLYLLGKEMFGRIVGLGSALGITSSFWFLYRARSGNLDIILTFFFLSTIYLAIKSKTNYRFTLPFTLSLILLFLTKSIVPFTILPALVVIFWGTEKKAIKRHLFSGLIFLLIFGGWFLYQALRSKGFVYHYFQIGLPGVGDESSILDNLKLAKQYLHNGIGKWFWPGTISLGLGVLSRKRAFVILFVFFASFFAPFLLSPRGHIWHLIPLHPIMILAFFGLIYSLGDRFYPKALPHKSITLGFIIIFISLYISQGQIRRAWWEFINIDAFVSDEEILSRQSQNYNGDLYIDGDFEPAAVFYSDKAVHQVHGNMLYDMFPLKENVMLITKLERLRFFDISPDLYEVVAEDRDRVLIVP